MHFLSIKVYLHWNTVVILKLEVRFIHYCFLLEYSQYQPLLFISQSMITRSTLSATMKLILILSTFLFSLEPVPEVSSHC